MEFEMDYLLTQLGSNAILVIVAIVIFVAIKSAVKIVPQSEKYIIERFGRLHTVLGPGINLIVPFLDRVAHRISILERQLPLHKQDAISSDNVLMQVQTSVFYRITEPEKTVYRISDIDAAIATTVAGIVRAEIGKMELDQVQSHRAEVIERIKDGVKLLVDDWGVEVTRAEILDIELDAATRAAMMQQLNADRAKRALIAEAEGKKRAIELEADASLYSSKQEAEAKRITADAEAYATQQIALSLKDNGMEAARFQVAIRQVEAMEEIAKGSGKQTIILPSAALEAFGDAFSMFKGKL